MTKPKTLVSCQYCVFSYAKETPKYAGLATKTIGEGAFSGTIDYPKYEGTESVLCCALYPKHEPTHPDHFCGQGKDKTV